MKIKELINFIENLYPLNYQESYDNSGLIVGDREAEIKKVLLSIDMSEEVVNEAVKKGANLIIAHHPIIFNPIKKLTGDTYEERAVIAAIKNDIALYAAHTSLDAALEGINKRIAEKLGLRDIHSLLPLKNKLRKLVTFVPKNYAELVREAIFNVGAGVIGNYDSCSYNIEGIGTFRAGENTNPFVGEKGKIHYEPEIRIETIVPEHLTSKVIQALLEAHPYEEVAYDIYPLENQYPKYGIGVGGSLPQPIDTKLFLLKIKDVLNIKCLKYSDIVKEKIQKVAICSGACGFILDKVIAKSYDVFISGEFKYHNYSTARNKILIVEAGHYETEILINEIFYNLITKNFSSFAVEISKYKNPVNYL